MRNLTLSQITYKNFITLAGLGLTLTACATTQEPAPIVEKAPEPVIVEPIRTCIPAYELERVVIPAVIKRGTSVTSIENTPQYVTDPETGEVRDVTPPPQEVHTPFERVITPEQVYYKNSFGEVVDDICPETLPEEDAEKLISSTAAPL